MSLRSMIIRATLLHRQDGRLPLAGANSQSPASRQRVPHRSCGSELALRNSYTWIPPLLLGFKVISGNR
jgi:hypothetical protein